MKNSLGLISALAFTVLTACGHSSSSTQTSAVTTPDTSGYIGGACNDQVAQDYDHMNEVCQLQASPNDRHLRTDDQCRRAAQDFLNKYPSVSCDLRDRDGHKGPERHRIEQGDIQALINGNR